MLKVTHNGRLQTPLKEWQGHDLDNESQVSKWWLYQPQLGVRVHFENGCMSPGLFGLQAPVCRLDVFRDPVLVAANHFQEHYLTASRTCPERGPLQGSSGCTSGLGNFLHRRRQCLTTFSIVHALLGVRGEIHRPKVWEHLKGAYVAPPPQNVTSQHLPSMVIKN